MNKLSIRHRLLLLIGILLAILIATAGYSVLRMRASNAVLESVYNDRVVPLKQIKTVSDGYAVGIVDTAHKVGSGRMKPADGIKAIVEARARVATEWKQYVSTYLVPKEKKLVEQAGPLLKQADAASEKLERLLQANDVNGVHAFAANEMYDLIDPVSAVMDDLTQVQLDVAESEFEQSQQTYRSLLIATVVASLLVLVVAAVSAWMLVRTIVRGINDAVQVAETVAAGDLTSQIEVRSTDEIGQLLTALKKMNDSLVRIVGSVRNSADSIATGSSQIAVGNTDLSQRTEEQASNLQQTAASMEQLTATVQQNAATALEATKLASSASDVAAHGGVVVGNVVTTMQGITASSQRIADIIGVIDGIAFQTNILALNAAVEAARAGEQGRGFAVVAGEVRVLAQRSAQAAKEIKTLIAESVDKVETGSKLVSDAGATMGNIVAQVKRVSDLIGEISAASNEQSSGIGQIGDAVQQLDQVTQQNAALVEESAAAAESLKHQAATLAHTVASFKLTA